MESLLSLARHAARSAGHVVMTHYGNTAYTLKDDNSPVTEADREANIVVVDILKESGIPVLSEEMPSIGIPYPPRLWVIDPLDGTKGFIHETDDFSVMIALLEHGQPTLGVVYAPALKTMYHARRGAGAYITDAEGTRSLKVSTRALIDLRIIMSVNHSRPYMHHVATALRVEEEVAIGSVGIKAGYLASDRGDFYLTRGALGEWDVCAPELIVTEAGGMVTDTQGQPLFYGNRDHRIQNGIIMSNGPCHHAVIEALKEVPEV